MDKQKLKIILAFGAIYIIWGSTYLAIKYAVEDIPPFLMMGVRSLSAGIILFAWSRFRNKAEFRKEHLPSLFIIGILFFLIGHGLLAWAQTHVPSGLAAVLVASEPLWVVMIESFFIRDSRVRLPGIAGLILGFAGIVYLVASTRGISTNNSDFIGAIAIIFGALSWGGGAVYARVANLPKSSMLSAGMELAIGGIFLLLTSYLIGEWNQFQVSELSLRSILGLVYLILFGSVITFSAYVWLLGHTSVTRISTHTYVNPVIAIFLGWLIGNEEITIALFVATITILASLYLVMSNQYRIKRKKINLNFTEEEL